MTDLTLVLVAVLIAGPWLLVGASLMLLVAVSRTVARIEAARSRCTWCDDLVDAPPVVHADSCTARNPDALPPLEPRNPQC